VLKKLGIGIVVLLAAVVAALILGVVGLLVWFFYIVQAESFDRSDEALVIFEEALDSINNGECRAVADMEVGFAQDAQFDRCEEIVALKGAQDIPSGELATRIVGGSIEYRIYEYETEFVDSAGRTVSLTMDMANGYQLTANYEVSG